MKDQMNPYESGQQKVVPAVLVYAKVGSKILMLHRLGGKAYREVKGEDDFHSGKWNGLGGKMEVGESPLETAVREFHEESGLKVDPSKFRSLGVLHFPNFVPHKSEDWIVYVYSADIDPKEAEPLEGREVHEGKMSWIEQSKLLELNLWEGDPFFLTHVIENQPFTGTFWYVDKKLDRHHVQVQG